MSKKDEELLTSELKNRISNLKSIENPGPFFREVARLSQWLMEVPLFGQALLALDLQSRKRDKESFEIIREIHKNGKKIWLTIKSIPFDLQKTPEVIRQSLAMLRQYYEMTHPQYGIGIYHSFRYVVEFLAQGKYSKKVKEYVDKNNDEKYPNLQGGIYKLFISYNKNQELIKKELTMSVWGAWDNLKYINYLASKDNDYPKLEDWAKVFHRDEYHTYLNKVSDYLFDWFFLGKGKKNDIPDPFLEFAIWEDNFEMNGSVLKLGVYGEVRFYPQRSPMKTDSDNKPTSTELILKEVFEGGEEGISKTNLSAKTGVLARDIPAYVSSINSRFANANKDGEITANVHITEIEDRLRLLVVPLSTVNKDPHKK